MELWVAMPPCSRAGAEGYTGKGCPLSQVTTMALPPQVPWKQAFRSLYYQHAPDPPDPRLERGRVALLVIDVQNVYLKREDPARLDAPGRAHYDAWTPFHERMQRTV